MAIIDGVEVIGPPGMGLPVVGGAPPQQIALTVLPPEFAVPPALPPPIEPLQPHPDYPATYPPPSVGRPTETGPKKVYYQKQDSGLALAPAPTGDMQANEYATNGEWGVVDWAQRANVAANVAWGGVTDLPSHIGTYWWVGQGAPGSNVPDALPGDLYLNSSNGDVYQLF